MPDDAPEGARMLAAHRFDLDLRELSHEEPRGDNLHALIRRDGAALIIEALGAEDKALSRLYGLRLHDCRILTDASMRRIPFWPALFRLAFCLITPSFFGHLSA